MATGSSRPPHSAPSGTRWVKGSDGKWMLHETDPEGWYRRMQVKGKKNKKNMKIKPDKKKTA